MARIEKSPQSDIFHEETEEDAMPIIQRIVPARAVAMPPIFFPTSVFELAKRIMSEKARSWDTDPVKLRCVQKLQMDTGIKRVIGAAYPERLTQDDIEKERKRRARQRPPKPTKKAKTRSRKLLDLIGDDDQGGYE